MTGSAEIAVVAVGSNLGDRRGHLERAAAALAASPGVRLLRRSSLIETDPVGGPAQGRFLNGAWLLETTLEPRELLTRLQALEADAGRRREVRNGPRTLDLDLIFHGSRIVTEPDLEIPHPRAHQRSFVLVPLAEVAPRLVHPRLGLTVRQLLERLQPAREGVQQ